MPTSTDSRLRLIYIVGAGRSGSTVLDTVLGNHPDTISVGELSNVHRSAWLNNEFCACGDRAGDCEFWSDVKSRWQAMSPGVTVQSYLGLRDRFERFRPAALWRTEAAALWQTSAARTYLEQTGHLLEAIAGVSGRRVIVDSSKTPLRARWLFRVPGIDVRLIHLVRDSRAVAWSRKKALDRDLTAGVQHALEARPAWYSVVYWTVSNLLAARLRRRAGDRGVLVRYEDFVQDPASELVRIGDACGLDCEPLAASLQAGDAFDVGHTVAGNRLRMAGAVRLKADYDWIEKLPHADRQTCWRLSGWLMRQYDYTRQAKAA
tara:strand:+ start:692 stop:1648 length:957 start_codon:yes stop_codon:yes gene_type:complete